MTSPQIFILTGVFDDAYIATRRDNPAICTSAGKRIILYDAIRTASETEVILLSPHPRGRGKPYPLEETHTTFADLRQIFPRAFAVRKVRFLLDMLSYAGHVFKHTRDGDLLVIDNYEIIHVVACWYCKLRGRRNSLVLEYEDGKHAIDKGLWKFFSSLAEVAGKPLLRGAIAATPSLLKRLPGKLPSEVVPGILNPQRPPPTKVVRGEKVRFIYSGSLDYERGIPLLLDYLEAGDLHDQAEFHITGQGHFIDRIREICKERNGQVRFHGMLPRTDLELLQSSCHFGLNLQSSTNPISEVTFPSKTFDYVNSGLRIVTTRSAGVDRVFGSNAIYIAEENVHSTAKAISEAVSRASEGDATGESEGMGRYTLQGTIERISALLTPLMA